MKGICYKPVRAADLLALWKRRFNRRTCNRCEDVDHHVAGLDVAARGPLHNDQCPLEGSQKAEDLQTRSIIGARQIARIIRQMLVDPVVRPIDGEEDRLVICGE